MKRIIGKCAFCISLSIFLYSCSNPFNEILEIREKIRKESAVVQSNPNNSPDPVPEPDNNEEEISSSDAFIAAISAGKTNLSLKTDVTISENFSIIGTTENPIKIDGGNDFHIDSDSGDLVLRNVELSGGYGNYSGGGMIKKTGGTLTMENVTIINSKNSGRNGGNGNGGVLCLLNLSSVNINKCIFRNDNSIPQAESGGILYINDCSYVTIDDTELSGGYASHGGAICVTSGSIVRISHCTIINNRADWNGGAFDVSGGTINITNSTFSGNTVDSGVYASKDYYISSGGSLYYDDAACFTDGGTNAGGTFQQVP